MARTRQSYPKSIINITRDERSGHQLLSCGIHHQCQRQCLEEHFQWASRNSFR
ncbi:unnamed protein product [Nezara viridula]|uniref:Uncharacterized protein n=1 Tax=Nezara viridula TaxID=85310 RepID=A0A9P0MSU4_NEZVI|nr:unnamed protein product [Nezara viridula]